MTSLEQKHLSAIEHSHWHEKKAEQLLQAIDTHLKTEQHPSVWHFEQTKAYTLEQSKQLDAMPFEERKQKPLWGLSVAVKDLFAVSGLPTTAGSHILKDFITPYDSTVWSTLKSQGALLALKASMDEFAMGSFTCTSYLGKTSIPGKPEYTAGGSSGGSAAALKAQLCDFSIGSDTGGSVRLPASFCGVVGYKPSYGAFSRYGMIAYASSLDQAGFFTQSLEDMSYVMKAKIAIKDTKDMTCVGLPSEYSLKSPQDITIGYFPSLLSSSDISPAILKAYEQRLKKYESLGCKLVAVDVPYMQHAAQIYYIVACAEASSNLARYQGVFWGQKLLATKAPAQDYWELVSQYRSEHFGQEVQKRIMLGSYILSSEQYDAMYGKATKLRQQLVMQFQQVFSQVDYLLLPVSPSTAPKWTEIEKMTTAQIYLSDFMTVPFSLAGLPALSIPSGQDEQGLDIGMQLVGKKFKDIEMIEQFKVLEAM